LSYGRNSSSAAPEFRHLGHVFPALIALGENSETSLSLEAFN